MQAQAPSTDFSQIVDMVTGEGHIKPQENESNVHVNCFYFNQDYSSFVCGTTTGFRVYTSVPVRESGRRQFSPTNVGNLQEHPAETAEQSSQTPFSGIGVVCMLFRTGLFPMVTTHVDNAIGSLSNKVTIWDDAKARVVAVLRSKYMVRGIAVRQEVIAMVCETVTYVYRADKLSILLHLKTAENKRGLCALAATGTPWVLACPGEAPGTIRVQVGQDERESCIFQAHKTPVAALSMNASGSLVASASEYGTVVKVFSTTGHTIHNFRRGRTSAAVSSLAFRTDDRFLAMASSTNSVHIFQINTEHGPDCDEREVIPSEQGSIAVFRTPDSDGGRPHQDVRSSSSMIVGPQVGFRGNESCFLVLHYNGVLYEVSFNEVVEDGIQQTCTYRDATTWFGIRHDFKVTDPCLELPTVAGGEFEDEEDGDEWHLLS
jgi:WD40 repeat protein